MLTNIPPKQTKKCLWDHFKQGGIQGKHQAVTTLLEVLYSNLIWISTQKHGSVSAAINDNHYKIWLLKNMKTPALL